MYSVERDVKTKINKSLGYYPYICQFEFNSLELIDPIIVFLLNCWKDWTTQIWHLCWKGELIDPIIVYLNCQKDWPNQIWHLCWKGYLFENWMKLKIKYLTLLFYSTSVWGKHQSCLYWSRSCFNLSFLFLSQIIKFDINYK